MLKSLKNKIQSLTQTQINIITAILILINLGIVVFWMNFWLSSRKITPSVVEEKPKEKTMEEQLRELDALRKNIPLLTEEEKKQQLKELDILGKETKPLTEEQTKEQFKELNKLRKVQ